MSDTSPIRMVPLDGLKSWHAGVRADRYAEKHAVLAVPVSEMRFLYLCPAEGIYGSTPCGCPESYRVLAADWPEDAT